MKNLFFLALLANLVFFLWQYNAGAFRHEADKPEPVNPNPKQIWLVSELEKKQSLTVAASHASAVKTTLTAPTAVISRPEKNNPQQPVISTVTNTTNVAVATKTPATPAAIASLPEKNNSPQTVVAPVTSTISATTTTAVKTFYCYQIKGFADKVAATRWTQQQSVDAASVQFKEIPPVVSDYVVNYPAAATFAESKKNIETLKAHGINNFFMINHGEFKGSISLGVFKNEVRAIKAQQIFTNKGINAKITKRYKSPATVLAQLKTEQTRLQLLATLTKYTQHPSVELLSKCE